MDPPTLVCKSVSEAEDVCLPPEDGRLQGQDSKGASSELPATESQLVPGNGRGKEEHHTKQLAIIQKDLTVINVIKLNSRESKYPGEQKTV